jgi:Leucine-rich repeat (LRR) protein
MKDFDTLWDYQHPEQSGQIFLKLLSETEQQKDSSYRLQLLTQIARAQGLQRHFTQANETLDRIAAQLTPDLVLAHIRYLLERGRVLNSSGHSNKAATWFQQAWELARAHEEAFYAIDAAHMLAIVSSPEEQLSWNMRAIDYAETTSDERARTWCGSLYNNLGWSYHDQGDYEQALQLFQKALLWQQTQHDSRETRIARWCVGRTLRSLQRTNEALALQQALLAEWEASGEEQDGYVFEEIAECLLVLGQTDQSRSYFSQAYTSLAQDSWLTATQPERIARLKQLMGDNITLSISEINIIQELEALLRSKNILDADKTIPIIDQKIITVHKSNIALSIENRSVVALTLRDCTLTALPASLGLLSHLQHLDVRGNQLTTLPATFAHLSQMQHIYLDDNQFTSLPTTFDSWTQLEQIHLDHNLLTSLPENIGQFTNLTTLNVYNNKLTSIPESLGQLINLREISLGNNLLKTLPASFWQLTNLEVLNIAENQLSSLSEDIANLLHLHTLDAAHNQLTALPEALGSLQNLTFYLYLSNNYLTNIPESLGNLTNLRYLNITDNQLRSLPESIGNLNNLKELRLYNNQLTTLPTSLGKLTYLKELHMKNNQLASLPESIGNLKQLRKLDLSNNKITSLPSSISNLSSLTDLDLRNNRVAALPSTIGKMGNLMYLDVRQNKLAALPESIGDLAKLEKLDLRWNKISLLLEGIHQLEQHGCSVYAS